MDAADEWSGALASWAIPDEILAAAPESPWGFDVKVFEQIADSVQHANTPSRAMAMDALPDGGTVLDVGCGAGAASLALVPKVGRAVGVDESAGMVAAFAARAERLAVAQETVLGRWPDVSGGAPVCDVVVCHHVVYNVPDIVPFLSALTSHAAKRVVVEMTAEHPLTWMNPLWHRLHGIERPTKPTAQSLVAVLSDMGMDAGTIRWSGARGPVHQLDVASVRRRLCLPADRDDEVEAAVAELPAASEREFVTVSWDVGG